MKKTVGDLTARDLVEGTPITLDGLTSRIAALGTIPRPSGPHLTIVWRDGDTLWSACTVDTPVEVHDPEGQAELEERFANQEETKAAAIEEIMLELPPAELPQLHLELPPAGFTGPLAGNSKPGPSGAGRYGAKVAHRQPRNKCHVDRARLTGPDCPVCAFNRTTPIKETT